jgi:hypothetical protein
VELALTDAESLDEPVLDVVASRGGGVRFESELLPHDAIAAPRSERHGENEGGTG